MQGLALKTENAYSSLPASDLKRLPPSFPGSSGNVELCNSLALNHAMKIRLA